MGILWSLDTTASLAFTLGYSRSGFQPFGGWVLLQPERINAYAMAVIRTLQADEHQRGCLMKERDLKGDLTW